MEEASTHTRIKVSFDFDGTLDKESIQRYAKELMSDENVEVWIVTSRYGDNELYQNFFKTSVHVDYANRDLWEIANSLGIPKGRVYFTNMEDKWKYFSDKDFLWHIDDDWVENRLILKNTKTKAISSFGNPNWKGKCQRILRKRLESNN